MYRSKHKFVFICLVGLLLTVSTSAKPLTTTDDSDFIGDPSDSCDWEGSGLTAGDDRVVVPIYLRCLQGTVKWLYPTSALQVTLNYGNSQSQANSDFRGCIKIAANSSAKVRLYVEGVYQSLHKVYAHDDGKHPELIRCFASNHGRVALYIEADKKSAGVMKEYFQFSYHLEPVNSIRALYNADDDECRPCTDYEMHTTYCTSDFVIRGSVTSLYNNEALQRTELSINAHNIVKDIVPMQSDSSSKSLSNRNTTIVLHRPLKCHAKAGRGSEFFFLGHWVLGNPVIKCAPKVSYWKHVKSRAIETAANQCQLD